MLVSGDLECTLRSLADLVEFVLKRIDLPFDLSKARARWRDKQALILAPGVAEEGNLHACRVVRCSGPNFELQGSDEMYRWLSLLGLRVRPLPAARQRSAGWVERDLGSACRR
jgi:hypothetical protein